MTICTVQCMTELFHDQSTTTSIELHRSKRTSLERAWIVESESGSIEVNLQKDKVLQSLKC